MRIEDAEQTVEGHPVRIYATDGGGWLPIHGAIWIEQYLEWKLMDWSRDGTSQRINDSFDLNLHDWKDKIPWGCLQNMVQWVTRDKDGDCWIAHTKKPSRGESVWEPADIYCVLCGIKMPEGPANWTDAIAKRPQS